MKIYGQDVPPEYADQMIQIITALPSEPGNPAKAHTSKKARRASKKFTSRPQLQGIIEACETLARRLEMQPAAPITREFVHARAREILIGVFNPNYWKEVPRKSTRMLFATAAYQLDTAPPPYAYRTPTNRPSIPIYGQAVASSGEPEYIGLRTDDIFHDGSLKWRRDVYDLIEPIDSPDYEPVFFTLSGTLNIIGDKRGSRPMTSIMVHKQFMRPGTAPASSPDPRITGALSFYWRYGIPKATAPFYNVIYPRNLVARLYPIEANLAGGYAQQLVLSIFPRPMLGRGYNNNNIVSVTLNETHQVYMIHPCATLRGDVLYTWGIWDGDTATVRQYTETVSKGSTTKDMMWKKLHTLPLLPNVLDGYSFRNQRYVETGNMVIDEWDHYKGEVNWNGSRGRRWVLRDTPC